MQQQAVAVNQVQSDTVVKQRVKRKPEPKAKVLSIGMVKKTTTEAMNKRHRRLFSYIVKTLLEHGNLDAHKAGIVALAKEAKVGKARLREFVELAREKHPEINQVMYVTKKIRTLKASGKDLNAAMFKHLQPEAKLAGKNDLWLGEQLGFMPSHIQDDLINAEKQNANTSFLGLLKR